MKKNNSKLSSLVEIIINNQKVKLDKLISLIQNYNNPNIPILEFVIQEDLIDKDALLKYIDLEIQQGRIYDKNLENLSKLPNANKWSELIKFENIGEILLRKKILKIEQLIQATREIKKNKKLSLEKILVKKSLITHKDLYEALKYSNNSKRVVENSYMELITLNDK